jgi:hypothetical protein
MRKIFFLALTVTIALISACGGGSSGGSSSGGGSITTNNPSNSTGMVVSFSTSTLNFEFIEGSLPKSENIFGYASGQTNQPIFVGAIVSGSSIQTPIPVLINATSKEAKITVTPMPNLKAGKYSGTIQLLACTTDACTKNHDGSPYTVTYNITVRERFSASEVYFSMLALEKSVSQVKIIDLHFPPGYNAANVEVSNGYGKKIDWLRVDLVGSQLSLRADASLLLASSRGETYPAQIKLNLPDNSQTLTLNLSLTVADIMGIPSKLTKRITDTTTGPELMESIVFSQNATLKEIKWTASSNQEWLKLAKTSGTFQTPLNWYIDPTVFSQTDSNRIQKAQISVNTDSGGKKVIEIEVEKNYSIISNIDAPTLHEQKAGYLMVYGQNFNKDTGNLVLIDGVKPSSSTFLGGSVLRVDSPPLKSGKYSITLNPLSGIKTTTKVFYVSKPIDYSNQEFPLLGKKRALIWDATSESIFFADQTSNKVYRFSLSSGKLQLMASKQFTNLDSIGLTVDHSELIVRSGGYLFSRLNPLSLSVTTTINLQNNYVNENSRLSLPLAILGDDRLVTIGIYGDNNFSNKGWLNFISNEKTPIDFNKLGMEELSSETLVSGDGNRLLWAGEKAPYGQTRISFDLISGTFKAERKSELSDRIPIGVTHDGSKWISKHYSKVYLENSSFNLLGDLQLPLNWMAMSATISRQGDRTYVYASSSSVTPSRQAKVFVFDTKSSVTSGSSFPVIGTIDIPITHSCSVQGGDPCLSDFSPPILITDDDRTLIIGDAGKLIVRSIPTEFKSVFQTGKPSIEMFRMN